MDRLPIISGKEAVAAFSKVGFVVRRQKGSHIILRRDEPFAQIVVPNHRTLDRGTLHSIIRGAGLTTDQFNELL